MRFEGTLVSWEDARGFGFIEPALGGDTVFVHIKAFPPGTGRPQAGQRLSFEVETRGDGRKRARAVQFPVPAKPRGPASRTTTAPMGPASEASRSASASAGRSTARGARPRGPSPAPWSLPRAIALPAFLALLLIAWTRRDMQPAVWAWYGVASVVSLFAYAFDKNAAEAGRRRTPERTLHALDLAGGWPGGLLAQQLLRHKTAKGSFIAVFWLTVIVNVAGFVAWQWGFWPGLPR